MQERRGSKRHPKRLKVDLKKKNTKKKILKGTTENISKKGAFIKSDERYPAGTLIDLTLFLPDGKLSSIKGIIRREKGNGSGEMGVEFLEMDENFVAFMDTLLDGKRRKN